MSIGRDTVDRAPLVYLEDGTPVRVRMVGATCEGDVSGEGHFGYHPPDLDGEHPTIYFEEDTSGDDETDPDAWYCAPTDFGLWHITTDENETLCGLPVQSHHLSGNVGYGGYDPERDCAQCRGVYAVQRRYRGDDDE